MEATSAAEITRGAQTVEDPQALHMSLAILQASRLVPTTPESAAPIDAARVALETRYLADERASVAWAASRAPRDAEAFCQWFDALEQNGPGQGDPLFDWLANDADIGAMRWFLQQELAGEAGFDDLVALTQVRIPRRAKLELARNYWDEMGAGNAQGMHGPMLDVLSLGMRLLRLPNSEVVWESLALANTLAGLASRREYTYQSIGALGAVERTAPGRAQKVVIGLRRLGIRGVARRYYALHSVLDVKHADRWRDEVLFPLVHEQPELAPHLAEGALMRLEAGRRCFVRYRSELGVPTGRGQIHGLVEVTEATTHEVCRGSSSTETASAR